MENGFRKFTPEKNKIYQFEKEVFKSTESGGLWIKDSKKELPFLFECVTCKISKIDLSKLGQVSTERFRLSMGRNRKFIPEGFLPWIIQCRNCQKIYNISTGYQEPNYGRDVITLTNIFEIKELVDVERAESVSLLKPEKGDNRISFEGKKIFDLISMQSKKSSIQFIFESVRAFHDINLNNQIEIFISSEDDFVLRYIDDLLEVVKNGIEKAVRKEESKRYKIVGNLGILISEIKVQKKEVGIFGIQKVNHKKFSIVDDQFENKIENVFLSILEKNRVKNPITDHSLDLIKIESLIVE